MEDQRKSKKNVNHQETVRRKAEREKKQAEKEQAKALKEREKAENEKRKAALTERDNHVAAMSSLAESLHEQSSSLRQNQAEANFGNEEMSDNEVLYLDDFDNTDTVSVVPTDSASSYNRNQHNDSVNKRTPLTQLTPPATTQEPKQYCKKHCWGKTSKKKGFKL